TTRATTSIWRVTLPERRVSVLRSMPGSVAVTATENFALPPAGTSTLAGVTSMPAPTPSSFTVTSPVAVTWSSRVAREPATTVSNPSERGETSKLPSPLDDEQAARTMNDTSAGFLDTFRLLGWRDP